jgi:hypothetical protein
MNYITSQVRALQQLMKINKSVKSDIISITLINIYYTYMRAAYLKCLTTAADELISELFTYLTFFVGSNIAFLSNFLHSLKCSIDRFTRLPHSINTEAGIPSPLIR